MKYFFPLATVGAVYFFLIRQAPVKPVVEAVTQSEAAPLTGGPRAGSAPAPGADAHTDPVKEPIDRTVHVLDQVKQRNGDGEF